MVTKNTCSQSVGQPYPVNGCSLKLIDRQRRIRVLLRSSVVLECLALLFDADMDFTNLFPRE